MAGAMVLVGCSDDGGGGPVATPGFEDCVDNPNTCNTGPVQQGGEIIWVINAAADGWNTLRAGSNSVYAVQAIQGILPETEFNHPDGSHEWNLDLLEGPGELISEDPQAWTYTLREEARWSDGTPMTADDFIFGWHILTGDEFGLCVGCEPASTSRTHQIESVVGSDNGKTVTITLLPGEANPEWQFSPLQAMPAHIARAQFDIDTPEGVGEASVWFNENRPDWSGGPWLIVEGDLETQVIKEPNPEWYGEPVNLDKIIKVFNTNEASWIPAIQTGEIHGGAPSATWPEDELRQLIDLDGVLVGIQSGAGWEHLDVNMDNSWLGADVALRQAIFTAIDSGEMATRLYGDLFPEIRNANNYSFRTFSPYNVDFIEGTGYGTGDSAAALQILEDAGYVLEDGVLTKDGEQVGPFRIRATGTTVRQTSLQLHQSYLADIGIELVIEHTDNLGETLVTQDYDLMQFGWSGGATFAAFPQQMLHSDSGSNFGKYNNPEVDELVLAAASAGSLDEAAALANQAVEIAISDAYVLPLFETPIPIFMVDNYINIRDNPTAGSRATYFGYNGWGVAAQ
jgi:peptide/nickel transport system substrate-binding protein